MTSAPLTIAVIGVSGYVGDMVMPFLYESLERNRIEELRVLSRTFDEGALKRVIAKGLTTQYTSYHNITSPTQVPVWN